MSDLTQATASDWYADVPRSIRKPTLIGMALLVFCFGGFGLWAFSAPLAAAVISQGRFVATGQNKIVQHYEGGIIQHILAREGDQVEADQPLIKLDETAARARQKQLYLRRVRLETVEARLKAQISDAATFEVPASIAAVMSDPEIAAMVESQQLAFQVWREKLNNETSMLEQSIRSLEFRANGYAQHEKSMRDQLELFNKELEGKQSLLKRGLLRATEVMALQRAIAQALGQLGQLGAQVSETQAQIVRYQREIEQAKGVQREAALSELQQVQGELDTVREQEYEANSVLRRATIDAPVAGTVVRSYYHTAGGVIESGKAIMEILPADVPLIIETQIKRTEIDNVRVGQAASVRLVALNQRTTPVLNGKVFYVSADALPAAQTAPGQEFYVARIELPASELSRVHGFHPTPGMPAEVLIQTAERTFFSYLVKPVMDSMSRAFTEQ
ncbi:HlyD family type I secretion periplasmic adaptor subunit [Nitratireductor aestuarii]|uniref:Membrane fusion protein (MFP) family protein n=1 Tax=Nitratireductor aestuarii TaxID=1735103 RepID=A0A916W3U6_9HYPH|nr:HlyD family type I secretion periplasmic adaptor subunit [Nitratireductor aestuarii]GGA63716.1 HlyD family type I secretion periplasmic adaptor subunit [Nitratireductor aestuarii]